MESKSASALAIVLLASVLFPHAAVRSSAQQPKQVTNPVAGDPKAIEQGKHLYRGRCAVCHGFDAKGYRGTDLTMGEWIYGGSDADLLRTITRGVPGTEMPGTTTMHDDEVWSIIAYLRTLAGPGPPAENRGDARRGEQIFWAKDKGNCGLCHAIDGRGGRLGPDLSRIGAARSTSALLREIRRPDEVVPVRFETVTVVTRDGRRFRGTRKNEDTFSIQLMTATEDILSFFKRDLAEVVDDPKSLMPAYGPQRLDDASLDDLVRYLRTLKGRQAAAQP